MFLHPASSTGADPLNAAPSPGPTRSFLPTAPIAFGLIFLIPGVAFSAGGGNASVYIEAQGTGGGIPSDCPYSVRPCTEVIVWAYGSDPENDGDYVWTDPGGDWILTEAYEAPYGPPPMDPYPHWSTRTYLAPSYDTVGTVFVLFDGTAGASCQLHSDCPPVDPIDLYAINAVEIDHDTYMARNLNPDYWPIESYAISITTTGYQACAIDWSASEKGYVDPNDDRKWIVPVDESGCFTITAITDCSSDSLDLKIYKVDTVEWIPHDPAKVTPPGPPLVTPM